MIINFCICDRCQDPIPEGTGAQVLKSTDAKGAYLTMHLCDKCFGKVFTASADKIISKQAEERRDEMRPIDACWVHADPILKHYLHAREKHPYFCDGILSPVEDYSGALANQRSRLADERSCGMVAACDLVDCELLEAYAEAANGNTAHAVEECYDAIAVLLRTIDVLEGRQKLGKPETKGAK